MVKVALARLLVVVAPSWRFMAALSLSLGGVLAFIWHDRGRSDDAAAAMPAVYDPLKAFDQRSPGKRRAGALAQTKQRLRARLNAVAPDWNPFEAPPPILARTGDICTSPLLIQGEPITADDPFGLSLTTPLGGTAGVSCFQPQHSPVVSLAQVQLPLGVVSRNDEDLVGILGNDNLPIQTVPEPGTWIMMIVGFFSAGWMLRQCRQSRVRLSIACHA